jgi:hypothetical protein
MVRAQAGAVANDRYFDSLSVGLQLIAHATPTFVAKMCASVQKVDILPYQIPVTRVMRDARECALESEPLLSPQGQSGGSIG